MRALTIACSIFLAATAHAAPKDVEAEVARLLSSTNFSAGTVEGLPARFWVDVSGRYHEQATTVLHVKTPPTEMRLQVRPSAPEDADLRRHNQLVDVAVGDAAFDDAFTVEGAPSDMVRAFVDAGLRTGLAAHDATVVTVDDAGLTISRAGVLESVDAARRFFAVGAHAARQLRDGIQPAAPLLTADQRANELQRLKTLRNRRQNNSLGTLIPVFFMGFALLAAIFFVRRRRR